MVASPAVRFVPGARPHVSIAADGTLAAICEATKITIVELPSCASFSELAIDSSTPSDVAWVGAPPRLLVLSRHPTHSSVSLLDPFGPRPLAELRIDSPMKLYAAVGNHALAIGASGAATIATSEKSLTTYQFPARAIPVTAGGAGSQFVVALSGSIEEWDPQSRMPKRRLKLSRPATITAVGGSDRVVWFTTSQEASRVEVIAFVNRGQPRAHDLPEPIASIASHPRSDMIACVGAESGRIWMVDLDGRMPARVVAPDGIGRAASIGIVLGRVAGVLAAQEGQPIVLATLDSQAPTPVIELASPFAAPPRTPAEASPVSPATGSDDTAPIPARTAGTDDTVPPPVVAIERSAMGSDETIPPPVGGHAGALFGSSRAAAIPGLAAKPALPTQPTVPPTTARGDRRGSAETIPFVISEERGALFTQFRERVARTAPRRVEPASLLWLDASPTWREELGAWARALFAGGPVTAPPASPASQLSARHELSPQGAAALALLYGAYLLGLDGAAPIDIARICGGWDDALGRGELGRANLATGGGTRIRIAELPRRALDEIIPRTGTLVGLPGAVALVGPCVIVASGPLSVIAEACMPSIGGAILAGHLDVEPQELVAEAAAYGAAALWRVRADQLDRVPTDQPMILVAEDEMTADLLAVPRLT